MRIKQSAKAFLLIILGVIISVCEVLNKLKVQAKSCTSENEETVTVCKY